MKWWQNIDWYIKKLHTDIAARGGLNCLRLLTNHFYFLRNKRVINCCGMNITNTTQILVEKQDAKPKYKAYASKLTRCKYLVMGFNLSVPTSFNRWLRYLIVHYDILKVPDLPALHDLCTIHRSRGTNMIQAPRFKLLLLNRHSLYI